MHPLHYIDRKTKKLEQENIFGERLLLFFYGPWIGRFLCQIISRIPFFSKFYGFLQKLPISKRKIAPFIEKYKIDSSEFLSYDFDSFNSFFIRKLKPECRPIAQGASVVCCPADGRYLFYPKIEQFQVKGKRFTLDEFLLDAKLAKQFEGGSMVIARLCPTDYHRFHFPIDCTPSKSVLINGPLFSVNPIALRRNIKILSQNKRSYTLLDDKILYMEVGATNVGSIHQTYTPNQPVVKGDEKGYFSFGGSTLILLFKHIQFDSDLLGHAHEVRCLFGQSMGRI